MPRTVKPDEYAARRREILQAAVELIHDKGYARMTIEDVLARTQMSKGALYHYFRSKSALLEGIVVSMGDSAAGEMQSVVDDPGLGAIEKMHAYFARSGAWKAENVTRWSTAAMRLWRDENNALLRQKLSQETMRLTAPLLEAIIRQGCDEKVFRHRLSTRGRRHHHRHGPEPDRRVHRRDRGGWIGGADIGGPHIRVVLAAYIQAFERILGAPSGSLSGN